MSQSCHNPHVQRGNTLVNFLFHPLTWMIGLILFVAWHFLYARYDYNKTNDLLHEKARGVYKVHMDNQDIIKLIREARSGIVRVNAPGNYSIALETWVISASYGTNGETSPWIEELVHVRQEYARNTLKSLDVSIEKIHAIQDKLSSFSPKLTDQEERIVDQLTSGTKLYELENEYMKVSKAITIKVRELGASEKIIKSYFNMIDNTLIERLASQ